MKPLFDYLVLNHSRIEIWIMNVVLTNYGNEVYEFEHTALPTYSQPGPKMGGGSFVMDFAHKTGIKHIGYEMRIRVFGYAPHFFSTFFSVLRVLGYAPRSFIRVLGYAPRLFFKMMATVRRLIVLLSLLVHWTVT